MSNLVDVHAHRITAGHARIREQGDYDAQIDAAFMIVLARIDEDFRHRGYDLDNPLCDVAGLLRDLQRNPRLSARPDDQFRRVPQPD